MIDYGAVPAADEIEVTVFGPGFGEAIAVHVGDGLWFLVDSCLEPESKQPASHHYLQRLGVGSNQVKAIVASHWHDDHVRGISRLADLYPEADFLMSSALNNAEAMAFLSAHNDAAAPGLTRGANELYKVLKKRENVFNVQQRSSILELAANGRNIRVSALSPVPAAFAQSIRHFAHYLPNKNGGSPVNHAPELKPNLEAIAIHIDFDGDAALLGSDLEDHDSCGWTAVVSDAWCTARRRGSAYKVAHHGSHTGEQAEIWNTLLEQGPSISMSPFNLGNVKLPTDDDRVRIRTKSRNAFISSGASKRPQMDAAILKRLGDVCNKLTSVNAGFGAIRLRKTIGAKSWATELFGDACKL